MSMRRNPSKEHIISMITGTILIEAEEKYMSGFKLKIFLVKHTC